MNDTILKAENVFFSYSDENTPSLNGINLEIKRGKKIAFMGANGSGKSTFFLCCNGIHKPSSGTIYFNGSPIDYSRKGLLHLRSKVGIIFQDPDNQLFSASVRQEISFGILNLGMSKEEASKEVDDVMAYLEITPFSDKPTHALSGGQKKLVSIADILVMKPDVIIFDEPAASLDPKHTKIVNEIVDKLSQQGITILMSTHDVNYACQWADEVFLFKDGQVLIHGTPLQVFTNKSALAATNLEQPICIELFENLCKKRILKPSLCVPRNIKELESYISDIRENVYYGQDSQQELKKAILVVSFGTSYHETRVKTIDAIEQRIQNAYPDYRVYRAWTSKMIMKKLLLRDGMKINTVSEAFEEMKKDGITDVIVQPTHVINGIENDLMQEDALSYQNQFRKISFGVPLLTSEEDNIAMINAVRSEFSDLSDEDVLVLMGHGTTHYANAIYSALDYTFKDMGYSNIFLGTVEAYPSIETLLKFVKAYHPRRVILAPFMIVAGDHAQNDMAGDDPESWKCQFEAAGYDVVCCMKGLGEYPMVQDLFVQHVEHAISIS